MIIKAIVFMKPDGKGKLHYVVKACENPMLPPLTKAHVKMNQDILASLEMPTTQMVDVEINFECIKCNFKTDSLELMEGHSRTHLGAVRQ